ncbi:LutC/YkgG family protein [Geomobilimonas luticola]|uniref:LUD domain-containing protein n=1 Tax=Geomobilimonas luticola TaxID=1114878 RepID=A0ABS5SDZ5_9BACT|nr:LUD domain-containing protein [Geomobilimonas luticola]MBT0652862.1 LUD domain-containing protein [Geomobilimonas luticola]
MVERFQVAAEAVGAVVKRFTTLADGADYVVSVAGTSPVAAPSLPPAIRQTLAGLAFAAPQDFPLANVGISVAHAGIAATGSLLLDLTDPTDRSATALPPVHLVFLDATTIVPTLADLAGLLEENLNRPSPAYLSLTTGPSRTADIERVLTIGVHGPKELHILMLEGDASWTRD